MSRSRSKPFEGHTSRGCPLAALLNREDPPGSYWLAEESVNRVAQRVIRRFERARSGDGRVHIWVANVGTPAQPQAQSGLRIDVLTDIPR